MALKKLMKFAPKFAVPNIYDMDCENDLILDEECLTTYVLQISNILQTFSKIGMGSLFSNLSLAYKAIDTLPLTLGSAKYCFFKLILIKTNLHLTMSEARLDNLMVISCNPDIDINMDDVINKYGPRSNCLRSNLLYQ